MRCKLLERLPIGNALLGRVLINLSGERGVIKVRFSTLCGPELEIASSLRRATSRHPQVLNGIGYLAGIVLATARAQSMKTCATGLNVRFFSLLMATGLG